MGMNKVEHIGIAVKDLDEAVARYTALLGTEPYKRETVESEGVVTVFFNAGNVKIELLHATHESSPIFRFIQKRGEGIHHIAYGVIDIHAERERMVANGFEAIGEIRPGADNKWVCFFHPRSANGVLTELCQESG
ncbi:MAG: methylmalonyl-CoA epimerase [Salibacteraceae bacterium]